MYKSLPKMKNVINTRSLFLFISFVLCMFLPMKKSFGNDKNISIYAYAHGKSSQDIKS